MRTWLFVLLMGCTVLTAMACADDDGTTSSTSDAGLTSNGTSSNGMVDAGDTGATSADTDPPDTEPVEQDVPMGPNPLDESLAMILEGLEEPQVPLEPVTGLDPALVELGRILFFDPILSGNKDVACASCHAPAFGMGDGLNLSVGTGITGIGAERTAEGYPGFIHRHAVDLFNRGDDRWTTMFWDNRIIETDDGTLQTPLGEDLPPGLDGVLAAQALFPFLDRAEMLGQPGDQAVDGTPNTLADLSDDDPGAIFEALVDRLRVLHRLPDRRAAPAFQRGPKRETE
ncbi:MAG: cytochrome-c peroxidase, partial [Myxococcota bacterium]